MFVHDFRFDGLVGTDFPGIEIKRHPALRWRMERIFLDEFVRMDRRQPVDDRIGTRQVGDWHKSVLDELIHIPDVPGQFVHGFLNTGYLADQILVGHGDLVQLSLQMNRRMRLDWQRVPSFRLMG